ncbi:hypothetical protein HK099_006237 [Clydaea vesicula]|uniref:Uncharacterized protein n=1 Tax=Clydaea vesicula TaxID=447962 RepID=A0AAD5U0I8_9FUNG|nr:hypothetical protein HK099_006237 [Clydaea vesicula]
MIFAFSCLSHNDLPKTNKQKVHSNTVNLYTNIQQNSSATTTIPQAITENKSSTVTVKPTRSILKKKRVQPMENKKEMVRSLSGSSITFSEVTLEYPTYSNSEYNRIGPKKKSYELADSEELQDEEAEYVEKLKKIKENKNEL